MYCRSLFHQACQTIGIILIILPVTYSTSSTNSTCSLYTTGLP